LIVAFNIAVSL